MLLEALFENGGLVLGEPELLSRGLTVFFIADASSLDVEIFAIGLSLAPLAAHARHRAVGRRHARLVFAVARGRQPVHVDAPKKRSGPDPARFEVGVSICMSDRKEIRTNQNKQKSN